MSQKRLRETTSWITEARREREIEDDLRVCRLIVLMIVRYMKENHLTQKELAEKLNVSPQYINKFLHGQDLDMKVSTVLRYGRILGIKLLEVPEQNHSEEVRSFFGATKKIMDSVQPARFDYMDPPYITLRVVPCVRRGVNLSGNPVS